ncbi:ATP synthase F0 subunit B [Desulfogranum marinum]|uniref:F0F1 ATP synthase subunit B family protein n=1 Tax=Desulfogranum marinum TaxID=453220 RepID=UPI0019660148|nr:ATP synthase F0 subunit B [Desulfogranum marinum]MBM9511438.1 ATP synthase F0 subunit B [Desulfogranum marinum]
MKSRIVGIIVPTLLLLLFSGAATIVLASASSHDESGKTAVHAEAAAANTHGEATGHTSIETVAPQAGAHAVAADAHAETGGHGEVGGSLAPAKLKDLFWRTVNFIALVILLVKFLAKPIATGLSGRQKQIKEELQELEAKRDDAQAEFKAFETRLAGMEEEMDRVVEKAISQAENEKKRILAEAEQAADDIKRQAEASIQGELEDAKRMLRDEVAEQAAAMAEELIVSNLTPADQVTITEQFLERVGTVQ